MTNTMNKPDVKLSEYQEAIIGKVLESAKAKKPIKIAVDAVAGSGKSTTIKYIALAAHQAGIAIDDIKITVFGRKNSKDLKAKLGGKWERSIGTLHSTGFMLIQKELGSWSRSDRIDEYKYQKIARELGYINSRGKDKTIGSLIKSDAISKDGGENSFLKIIDLLRLTLKEPATREVEEIIEHFQIENIRDAHIIATAAREILHVGQELALEKKIDFTDQIWLPVVWELHKKSWFKPYKLVLIDEAQDLNAAQLQLSIALCDPHSGIGVYVGDPYQAVMGFSGADCDSWKNIVEANNAIEMPLSMCYRCGKQHIELVNQLFPEIPIKAYEGNHDGEIIQIKASELDKHLTKGMKNIMVVARKTAPLVSECIKLISRGIPAQVKGRDIGASLVNEVEAIAKTSGFSWENFAYWIEQYRIAKLTTYQGRDNYEKLKEDLSDRLSAILAIYDALTAKSLDAFRIYTEDLFSDTDEESVIYLSTVHSAKGLERDDIIIIKPADLPMRWRDILPWQEQQEDNLHYVALTRAKNRLIIAGDCNWYQPQKEECLEEPDAKEEEDEVCGSHTEEESGFAEMYAQLEQEIREYFKAARLKEPKLTQAYEGVLNVASGTMGRDDIDERVKMFFSPAHRPAVKRFANKFCDIREEELFAQSTKQEAIEAHLEKQREALGMRNDYYEYDGEVQITPDQILVKGLYKTYTYPRSAGIPDWASMFPVLYYPGCEPKPVEKNGVNEQVCDPHTNQSISSADLDDNSLKNAVDRAIARFGSKAIILQAIQQARVEEIAEIMAILDDW